MPGHAKMHGMSPSRPWGCVQANYQKLIPNLQFTHCIMHTVLRLVVLRVIK